MYIWREWYINVYHLWDDWYIPYTALNWWMQIKRLLLSRLFWPRPQAPRCVRPCIASVHSNPHAIRVLSDRRRKPRPSYSCIGCSLSRTSHALQKRVRGLARFPVPWEIIILGYLDFELAYGPYTGTISGVAPIQTGEVPWWWRISHPINSLNNERDRS